MPGSNAPCVLRFRQEGRAGGVDAYASSQFDRMCAHRRVSAGDMSGEQQRQQLRNTGRFAHAFQSQAISSQTKTACSARCDARDQSFGGGDSISFTRIGVGGAPTDKADSRLGFRPVSSGSVPKTDIFRQSFHDVFWPRGLIRLRGLYLVAIPPATAEGSKVFCAATAFWLSPCVDLSISTHPSDRLVSKYRYEVHRT